MIGAWEGDGSEIWSFRVFTVKGILLVVEPSGKREWLVDIGVGE